MASEQKRAFLFLVLASALTGWLYSAEEVRPFAWCAPEVASGHISIGRVKVVQPVQNFDAGIGAKYRPLGYVWTSVWSLTDLSTSYRDRRGAFWNEIDPMVGCGRTFEIAEGYSFDTKCAAQWNYMAGYEGADRRSYDEWQIAETFSTPYLTPWFAMRNFYWPVAKASWRAGLQHEFSLTKDLSLLCNVWIDGGGERWNQQRFGYRRPERIQSGINSSSLRLYLNYSVSSWFSVYGGVTGYVVVMKAIREELRDNPSEEAKDLYAVATLGIRVSY